MAFAIPRFNAQPGQSGPLAPRMDPGEAAAGGLMLARAGRQAMDASVEIQRQAQGMRRMEALAGASQEMADLAGEVDKATDPDAIRPMIQQRAEAIRQKWLANLSGDAEGIASVGLRLTESVAGLTRAGDRRTLALRTDAFNARVLDAQRDLTNRAASGDAEAVRTFEALLQEGVRSGFYGPTDAAKQQQAFQAEVQSAQVLRMIRTDPAGAIAALDSGRFTGLRADQRERLLGAATSRQQANATMAWTNLQRQEVLARRNLEQAQEGRFRELFSDVVDAYRRGETPDIQPAEISLGLQGINRDQFNFLQGFVTHRTQGRDNPRAVLDLQTRLLTGDVQADILRYADPAQQGGAQLSQPTAIRLIEENARRRQEEQTRSDADARRSFATSEEEESFRRITTFVGGDKPLVQLTDAQAARVVLAQREYMDRIRAGENPRDVEMDVTTRYRQGGASGAMQPELLPKPRFTERPTSRAEAQAMGQALRTRLDAGEINQATYDREAGLLGEYFRALPEPQPPQPAQPARGSSRSGSTPGARQGQR